MGRTSPADIQRRAGIIDARSTAIAAMNNNLRRKFTLIETSINDRRAENLRYYYQLGKICEAIREAPGKYCGTNGESGLKLIEQALSTQARFLRKVASFARICAQDELDDLISWYNTDTGFTLHWGHVSFLLTLENRQHREEFAEITVEEMLDPGALHTRIKERFNRTGGGGRGHKIPKGVPAKLRQMHQTVKTFLDKHEKVWHNEDETLFGEVMNLTLSEVDDDMKDKLTELQTMMNSVVDAANQNVGLLERSVEYVDGLLKEAQKTPAKGAKKKKKDSRVISLS